MGTELGMLWDFVLGSFKLDREGSASSASFARRVNSAVMPLDDCFRNRQSQTKTSQWTPRVLLKHFKYFRKKVRFNSFPAVCDLKDTFSSPSLKDRTDIVPPSGVNFLA